VVSAAEDPLAREVFVGGRYMPFGEFTVADARACASELSAAAGWGPTARVASVARGWSELAAALTAAGAATVAELPAEQVQAFARKLWVVAPDLL
jgi:hypothetical protein